jgi:hypothetical protein
LESIAEKRDITNTKKRFHTTTLENAQNASTIFLFLVDGTKIQKSRVGTEVKKLVARTKIKEVSIETKNLWPIKILDSCIRKRVSHYNLGKCTRCKHNFFVQGGWN